MSVVLMAPDRKNLQIARLRGGAGRTRTNHQSVMEHGWCPTNSPGRTPIQIAGRFAVLLDLPGFLILNQPPKRYGTWFESDQLPWSDTLEPTTKVLWNMGVSDQPTSSDTRARAQKSRLVRDCNVLRKAVRVRPAHHVGLTLH